MRHNNFADKVVYSVLVSLAIASAASAAEVELLLDVVHTNATSGRWNLYAKSSDFGLAAVSTALVGVEPFSPIAIHAPRGSVYGSQPAGFAPTIATQGNVTRLAFAQMPNPNIPEQFQVMFYGVGATTNGQPGDVGPLPPSIAPSSFAGVPWATSSPAPGWSTGVRLASGPFSGQVPQFHSSLHAASVFAALPGPGGFDLESAIIARITQTNLGSGSGAGLGGDYNGDGVVDAADYTAWRNANGTAEGYQQWKDDYGQQVGGQGALAMQVPEPSSIVGFVMLAVLSFFGRTSSSSASRAAA